MYKHKYAFINQFHRSKAKHPAIPFMDNSEIPVKRQTKYIDIKKNKH